MHSPRPDPNLVDALVALDGCDGYIVLVGDPQTGESDAHGPFDGIGATLTADRLRGELDTDGLADVHVEVIRLHHPRQSPRRGGWGSRLSRLRRPARASRRWPGQR